MDGLHDLYPRILLKSNAICCGTIIECNVIAQWISIPVGTINLLPARG